MSLMSASATRYSYMWVWSWSMLWRVWLAWTQHGARYLRWINYVLTARRHDVGWNSDRMRNGSRRLGRRSSRGVHAVGCGSVVLEKVEYRPLLLDLWGQWAYHIWAKNWTQSVQCGVSNYRKNELFSWNGVFFLSSIFYPCRSQRSI